MDETVESFMKALRLLECFDLARPVHTISSLAAAGGVSRPTARRVLLTLVAEGYAEETEGVFRLTPRLLGLGVRQFARMSLPEVARPILRRMADEGGEMAALAVRGGEGYVFVEHQAPRKIIQVSLPLGLASGHPGGAFDRAFTLPPEPGQVWATAGEPLAGLRALASQVRGRSGGVQCALGFVYPASWEPDLSHLEGVLRAASASLEADLAHLVPLDDRLGTDA